MVTTQERGKGGVTAALGEVSGTREAIPDNIRFAVFVRDGFACRYCGGRPPEVRLVLDHRESVRDGGGDDANNLITACRRCNSGKGGDSLPGNMLPPPGIADGVVIVRDNPHPLIGMFFAVWNVYALPETSAHHEHYRGVITRVDTVGQFIGYRPEDRVFFVVYLDNFRIKTPCGVGTLLAGDVLPSLSSVRHGDGRLELWDGIVSVSRSAQNLKFRINRAILAARVGADPRIRSGIIRGTDFYPIPGEYGDGWFDQDVPYPEAFRVDANPVQEDTEGGQFSASRQTPTMPPRASVVPRERFTPRSEGNIPGMIVPSFSA